MERSETSDASSSAARAADLVDALVTVAARLGSDGGWITAIDEVLPAIGRAAGASRVFVTQDFRDPDGRPSRTVEAEWCAPGVEHAFSQEEREGLAETDPRFGCAALSLDDGPAVTVQSCGDPDETAALEALRVSAIAMVRVDASGGSWGALGLHYPAGSAGPTSLSLKVLRATAAVIGTAVGRGISRPPVAQLEDFVESIPAVLYVDHVAHRFHAAYVAPQIESLLGVPRLEWLSQRDAWKRHMHPDDWDRVRSEYEQFAAGPPDSVPRTLRQEYRMIRADGRTVCIRDELTVVADPHGPSGLVRGLMYDITEQKVLQDRLNAAHDRIRDLTEALSELEDHVGR